MKLWQPWAVIAVVALATGAAQAQPPGGGRGGFQQPLHVLVLTNADLQKELKVTDDQKKALKDVMDKAADLNKRRMELFTGGAPDMDKLQEMMKEGEKLTEDAKAATDKAFTDDQKKRVKQIDVQRLGMRAFANEDVVKALKLTDDQKAKLKTVSEEYTKAATDLRGEYFQQGQFPDMDKMAEYQKKAATLTSESMEKAAKELTDDQKKAWKEQVGEKFDVSKLQFRPMRRDN
jgi:Spy/CpxP family protein refolding chaperone